MLLLGMDGRAAAVEVSTLCPYETENTPLCDPTPSLLGIPLRDSKPAYHIKALNIHASVQFTVAKKWNQPRCPSTCKCMIKMWDMCMTDFVQVKSKIKP